MMFDIVIVRTGVTIAKKLPLHEAKTRCRQHNAKVKKTDQWAAFVPASPKGGA